jgi:hypothetical protein
MPVKNERRKNVEFTRGVRATFVTDKKTVDAISSICEAEGVSPSLFYRMVGRAVIREGGAAQFMHYVNGLPDNE